MRNDKNLQCAEGEWPPATETIKYILDDKIIFPGKVAEEINGRVFFKEDCEF